MFLTIRRSGKGVKSILESQLEQDLIQQISSHLWTPGDQIERPLSPVVPPLLEDEREAAALAPQLLRRLGNPAQLRKEKSTSTSRSTLQNNCTWCFFSTSLNVSVANPTLTSTTLARSTVRRRRSLPPLMSGWRSRSGSWWREPRR